MQKVFVRKSTALLAAIASLSALASVHAGDPPDPSSPAPELTPAEKAAAKLKYNLFDPTPDNLLRPFSSDRPSKTDSPYTVDAGRLQLEADFSNFTYDRYNALGTNTRVETLLVAPTFLRLGLFLNTEIQVFIPTYEQVRTDTRTPAATSARAQRDVTTADGYGDTLVRLKFNLVGNDGGKFTLAVIPLIKLPTASDDLGNGRVEGAVNFPINYSLPAGFTLFAQTRYDFLYNGDNKGYHALFSNDIGVTRTIPGVFGDKLSGYAEFASAVSSRQSRRDPLVLTADTGLIYQLTPTIALDVNGFFGLTRGAPDVNVFGGIAVRF